MDSEVAFASVQSTSGGHPYISLDLQDGCQPTPVLPPLPLDENVRQAAQKHLEQRYLELTPEQVSGPTHKAGHITRSIFINTSLWNEPAMAPTAVVPTLPEKRGAECGYQQLELGDEEQLARYPVLQAIRSGIKLDAESYTRGSYQTVPIVPGGTAWGRAAPHEGQSSKAQAWLKEYMSFTLPSVSLEALGESCFAQTAVTPDADPSPHAAQQDEQPGEASPESVLPRDKTSGRVLKLDSLFKGIYTGAAPSSDTPVASSQASLKLPSHESASKLPPRPPSTPGSDRYYAGGKRASAEKALHRATQSEKGLSKSSSWHADRGISGGAAAGTSAGSGISLTARNLVLKEKMEKKEKEKSQTKKHAMASRPESVAMVGIMDEEELEALAEEQRDEVPELPVHDDLELVLRASEMTVAAPTSAHAATSGPAPVIRPRRAGDKEYAMENSVAELHSSFEALRPRLAMTWPFELDTFQKEGVVLMEEGESVFVAAHTSAGKTVLAEYAFALAELHRTKAVYTAPVKAISNQKFRDLGKKFDVGLLTGDVQIKPEANCLIMTTEVLRSMLYRGANLVRDIEWVIFDEVHYISDDDRGIVYEEVIIMLPPHVNIVMLSATVPNKVDFADWVGGIRQKRMHICGTNKRPVPLQHNIYFNKKLYPVCTGKTFDYKAYNIAKASFKNASPAKGGAPQGRGGSPAGRGAPGGDGRGRGGGHNQPTAKQIAGRAVAQHQRSQGGRGGRGGSEKQQWTELIHTLREKELLPCINFMFSKKRIATTAQQLMHLNLCSEKEKAYIHAFIDRSLARLKPEDRDLPQIQQLRLMLASGVAMHHAGLLPIMKEVVEMLFCEGLVRVLFATDTFAMGVNAPARSVSFWHIKKPDGEEGLRVLRPDEYVQMAGRAGRRGLDDVGTVLVVAQPDSEFPSEENLKKLMVGAGGSLKSKFRLEYRMILSLLRVRDFKVEDMMRSSFSEFASKQQFPELRRKDEEAEKLMHELESKPWPEGPSKEEIGEYVDLVDRAQMLNAKMRDVSLQTLHFAERLVTGAVVMVDSDQNAGPRLAVVLGLDAAIKAQAEELQAGGTLGSSKKSQKSKGGGAKMKVDSVNAAETLYVLTLHERHHQLDVPDAHDRVKDMNDQFDGMQLTVAKGRWAAPALPRYGKCQQHGWVMHSATPENVMSFVEGCKVQVDPLQLLRANPEQRALDSAVMDLMRVQESVTEDSLMLPGDLKHLAPDWKAVMGAMQAHAAHFAPQKSEAVARVRSERKLQAVQKEIKNQLSGSNLSLLPEYGFKLSILKDLEFVSETEVVKMKGRVACEISTCECLIATEAIFQGLFSDLTPAEALSLLCCLVNQNKVAEASFARVPDALKAAVESLTKVVTQLGELQQKAGLVDINPEEYTAANVRPSMTEVTYLWAEGQLFSAVCDVMPDGVMEGDVVRTVTRLEHACQDMCNAARVMGNTALYDQFEEASRLIKRDIIFAASLYVS